MDSFASSITRFEATLPPPIRRRSYSNPERGSRLFRRTSSQTPTSPDLPPTRVRPSNASGSWSFPTPAKRLFQSMKARMKASNLDTHNIEERDFQWSLPKSDDVSTHDLTTKLIEAPLTVSDDELKKLLVLERSRWTPKDQRDGAHHFYIRSFPVRVDMFLQILHTLIENHSCPPKLKAWGMAAGRMAPSLTIWLRYCGTTEESVWERQIKLYHQRDSFYSTFYRFLDSKYPEIIRNSATYEVTEARLPLEFQTIRVNLREQALITLFGLENLLNSQTGGKGCTISMDHEDEIWFQSLQVQTYSHIINKTVPASESVRQSVAVYVDNVKDYLRHREKQSSDVLGFTEETGNMLTDQSMPRTTKGELVPSVVLGIDPIEDSFVNARSFFQTTCSATTAIVRTIFEHMIAWELDLPQLDSMRVSDLYSRNGLPFVDLYAWPKKQDNNIDAALRLTASYVRNVNPVVIMSFSNKVSSCAATGFQTSDGIPEKEFVSSVGIPRLVEMGSTQSDHIYVLIPSYHPGVLVQYPANVQASLCKIIAYSFFTFWMGISCAIIAAETLVSRRSICRSVLDSILVSCGPETPFSIRLRKLKSQFRTDLKRNRDHTATLRSLIVPLSDEERLHNRRGMAEAGQEVGRGMKKPALTLIGDDPLSAQLRNQVTVWQTAQKQLIELLSQGKNCDILRARDVTRCQLGDTDQLLSLFITQHASSPFNGFTRDKKALGLAVANFRSWLRNIPTSGRTMDMIISVAYSKWIRLLENKAPDLVNALRWELYHTEKPTAPWRKHPEGVEVHVRSSKGDRVRAKLRFSWITRSGHVCTLDKLWLPEGTEIIFPGEVRILLFTEDGINIKDNNGYILGLSGNRTMTMSRYMVVSKLTDDPFKDEFMLFWDHQLDGPESEDKPKNSLSSMKRERNKTSADETIQPENGRKKPRLTRAKSP